MERLNHNPELANENKESKEIIDAEFDNMLRSAHKVNEGASGIILKLDVEEFSPKLIGELRKNGIEITENTAAKLLKIYAPGAAKREFEMQGQAHKIIKNAEQNEISTVPTPLFFSEIKVSEETKENLRLQGAGINTNSVEIVLMDWIPGEDLATKMYKKIIELHPDHPAQPGNFEDFKDLQYAVSVMLGFEKPNASVSEEEKKSNEAEVYKRNLNKVYQFLKSKNIVLNPNIAKQLKASVEVLHHHNFYHNDIHERNVEVAGNAFDNSEIQTYLIDFDLASVGARENVLSDTDLLSKLTKNEAHENQLDHLDYYLDLYSNNKNFLQTYNLVKKAALADPKKGVMAAHSLFFDDDGYKSLVTIEKLLREKIISSEVAKAGMQSILGMPHKRHDRTSNYEAYSKRLST